MGGLVPFAYGDALVRVVEINAAPWWVAGDVAKVLGYSHTPSMVRILDDDEKGVHNVHTLGGQQELTVISESGLFHAILKSRRPEAKPFRKWVTGEVLPALRRDGFYAMHGARTEQVPEDWGATMERRICHLERLLGAQEMAETTPYARAITYAPPVFRLHHADGRLRGQRYSPYWHDLAIREAIIARHRQMSIAQAVTEIAAEFGAARAPSKSALHRLWKLLDQTRGVKETIQ